MARKRPNWPGLLADTVRMGFEANLVIAMRLAKIASGAGAKAESRRMVEEKVRAAQQASVSAARAVLSGKAHLAPKRALSVYEKRVRKNLRRLTK
ncbi:hypothetical protein [Methylocystis bryophila]|uniref:Antifreeze protein n=1 Tax=Methylocystis bryophila TaxID=655015 RepID=A0A1W6N045_9HYPH|nr:hypothetical protein [Methylocystis bryophila]ARN83201.1 hypothetical protein B1812_21345 [Methylocystis bryophila]BDV39541.1 hypothetical protein DSM21852_27940 [Methylocystis bryophila]